MSELALLTEVNRNGRVELEPFTLLDIDAVMALPEPSWLIDDLIPDNSLATLFGAPGAFKSFLALDWFLCVASGLAWHGHKIERPGWAVYVAAEGRAGLRGRVQAWRYEHGAPDCSRARFLPEVVNLRDHSTIDRLRRTLAALPECPRLLVIDTMARSMVGADENSAKDVGEFIAGLDVQPADVTLALHHTGKAGGDERGSSALQGAADLRMKLDRSGPYGELTCAKSKDSSEWGAIKLRLESSQLGSCVLSMVQGSDARAAQRDELRERVLALVREAGPVSQNVVEKQVEGRRELVREALRELESEDQITRSEDGWQVRPETRGAPGRTPPGDTPSGRAPGVGEDPEGVPPRGAPPGVDECARAPMGADAPGAPIATGLLVDRFEGEDAAVDAIAAAFDARELEPGKLEPSDAIVYDYRVRDEDRYVSSAEAPELLGVTRAKLAAMRRAGEVPSIGQTQTEYNAARAAAGWGDKDRGWEPRVFYRLSELRKLAVAP